MAQRTFYFQVAVKRLKSKTFRSIKSTEKYGNAGANKNEAYLAYNLQTVLNNIGTVLTEQFHDINRTDFI